MSSIALMKREERDTARNHLGAIIGATCGAAAIIAILVAIIVFARRRKAKQRRERERGGKSGHDLEHANGNGTDANYPFR